MILEIVEGPEIGRRIRVLEGATITLGRANSSMEMFAGDSNMSALHLAVSLSAGALRLQNFSHTNGTLVNGERVESIVLQAGDQIRAGGTIFKVMGPPPNPYPAQLRVGGWGFNIIPEGWTALPSVGLRREDAGEFQASAVALEELLPAGKTLHEYIEAQMEVANTQLTGAEFQAPVDARMEGSEEALLLKVSSESNDARIAQRQIYARSGEIVGILTLSGLADVNQDLIEIVRGASFHKPRID